MRMRIAVSAALLLGLILGSGLALAREPGTSDKVSSQELFIRELAGDPSKEVVSQLYTFKPGAVTPWHIHPDTHEVAYVIKGTFTCDRAGEAPKLMHAGDADYVAPNVVHRGMNLSGAPVNLFVVRIKPKDAPLAQDVPAPAIESRRNGPISERRATSCASGHKVRWARLAPPRTSGRN
jgi:quercetin dioxygenase-like cupin family protein